MRWQAHVPCDQEQDERAGNGLADPRGRMRASSRGSLPAYFPHDSLHHTRFAVPRRLRRLDNEGEQVCRLLRFVEQLVTCRTQRDMPVNLRRIGGW